MLLQQVLDQLDSELNRLFTLREIVRSLQDVSEAIEHLVPVAAQPASAQVPVAQPEVIPVTATKVVSRRGFMKRTRKITRTAEPTALTSAIPAGPVMIPAGALALEREARRASRAPEKAEAAEATSATPEVADAFVRSLTQRWLGNGDAA